MHRAFFYIVFRTSAKCKIQNATERHPEGLVRISHFVIGQNPFANKQAARILFIGLITKNKIFIIL